MLSKKKVEHYLTINIGLKKMNLESRFFYRFVNVMHFFSIILFLLITCIILIQAIPPKIIDMDNSYISCFDDSHYPLSAFSEKNTPLLKNIPIFYILDEIARQLCLDKNPKHLNDGKNYEIKISHQERNWGDFFAITICCLVAFVIFFSILNIIREALIYIAFGRKLTWGWLFIFKLPFRFKIANRLNRFQHLKVQLIALLPVIIFFLPVILISGESDFKDGKIPMVIYFLIDIFVALPWLIVAISASIARLHDCNRSGWWMLLIIPLSFSFFAPIFLLCTWPGSNGENKYGRSTKQIWISKLQMQIESIL